MSQGVSKYKRFLLTIGIRTNSKYRKAMRISSVVLGLIAAFFVSLLLESAENWFAALVLLLVIFFALLEFVFADSLADNSFPFETERKLELMEEELGSGAIKIISSKLESFIGELTGCDDKKVSSTVHILTEVNSSDSKSLRMGLLQLTDYVGLSGGRKGRITNIRQGVIGRCARTGEMEVVDFASREEYLKSMVKEFGFTKAETDMHTSSARSYLAYPIKRSEKMIGVIYFFSTEPQVFPLSANLDSLNKLSCDLSEILSLVKFT